jgi:hypothetical protein
MGECHFAVTGMAFIIKIFLLQYVLLHIIHFLAFGMIIRA